MQRLQGIAVSPGVAIGEAMVLDPGGFRIPRRFITRDALPQESARLRVAFAEAEKEIDKSREATLSQLGPRYAAIFDAHLQMLRDPRLLQEIEQQMQERHYSPEYAINRAIRHFAQLLANVDNEYLAERAHDFYDIESRLMRFLLGKRSSQVKPSTNPVIVLSHNLTPSQTAALDPQTVLAFATEIGGPASHTAIVAEALEIPAVVGTGEFLAEISDGDPVIVDADQGLVLLNPDQETIAQYRRLLEARRSRAVNLKEGSELPAVTADGVRVALLGNIEFPHEAQHLLDRGSDGVGLFRTEFLYLKEAARQPSEDEQFEAYSAVARAMGDKPVIIRTLDLGADKLAENTSQADEVNPFLGMRSIRLSLRNLPIFRTQLRAILRTSVLGNVSVMFPLISTIVELRQAKMVLGEVVDDLREEGLAISTKIPIGMMVEVPSAVVMLDNFLKEVDFISIGTNDLIQYTLAVDRNNKDVATLYDPADPAIVKMLALSIRSANQAGIPVNVCGQMSGSTLYTMLLLGLGLRQMSVAPASLPAIKKFVRKVAMSHCEAVANRALELDNARDLREFLKDELRKIPVETP